MTIGIFYLRALPYQLIGRISHNGVGLYEITDVVRLATGMSAQNGQNQATTMMIPEFHFAFSKLKIKSEDCIGVADFEKVGSQTEVRQYENILDQLRAARAGLHTLGPKLV